MISCTGTYSLPYIFFTTVVSVSSVLVRAHPVSLTSQCMRLHIFMVLGCILSHLLSVKGLSMTSALPNCGGKMCECRVIFHENVLFRTRLLSRRRLSGEGKPLTTCTSILICWSAATSRAPCCLRCPTWPKSPPSSADESSPSTSAVMWTSSTVR